VNSAKQQAGISIVAIVIVLLIAGLVMTTLTPFLVSKYIRSMEGGDYQALQKAGTALISYALSNGGFPFPVDAASSGVGPNQLCNVYGQAVSSGTTGATACRMPAAAGGTGAVPILGVNNWGMYGPENPYRMDVNASLVTSGTLRALCDKAQAQLNNATALPRVCVDNPCTSSYPVAFVIYSTGTNRIPDMNNAKNTRIYDNDKRGIDNSPGANHYDDQLLSYPLSALAAACAKLTPNVPTSVGGVCTLTPLIATISKGSTQTFSVTSCNFTPITYAWTVDGVIVGSNSASYTTNSGLTAGAHTVVVTVSDAAGHTTTLTGTLQVNTCTLTPATASIPLGNTQTFSVTSCNFTPTTYAWTVDGVTVGGNSASYTTNSGLAAGTHTVTVTVSDALGNIINLTGSLNINRCTLTPATANIILGSSQSYSVSCNFIPTTYVWSVDSIIVAGNSSGYSTDPTLAAGTHTVQVAASDGAGNTASSSASLNVGIVVSPPPPQTYSYYDAVAYCAGVINGTTGWSLPTVAQMLAMISAGQLNNPPWPNGTYWTSDVYTYGGAGSFHDTVDLPGGTIGHDNDNKKDYVVCVKIVLSNVALASAGGVPSASSTYFSGMFPLASVNNDETTGSGWATGNVANGGWNSAGTPSAANPDWVKITFSSSRTISQMVVYSLQDAPLSSLAGTLPPVTVSTTGLMYGLIDYQVQVLSPANSWVTVGSVTGNTWAMNTFDFTPYATTAIRVYITKAEGPGFYYSRIVEIQAWGY
jgi:hypothetical protein